MTCRDLSPQLENKGQLEACVVQKLFILVDIGTFDGEQKNFWNQFS